MISKKQKSGFTLIEIIIAIGIFVIISTLAITVFFGIVTLEKKIGLRYAIYDDAKLLMQQIAYEVQNNTIDYNEYFSHEVLQPAIFNVNTLPNKETYGLYHGIYHSRFYNPGDSLEDNPTDNPKNLGYECSKRNNGNGKCNVVYTLSRDYETGQNPYIGKMPITDGDAAVSPDDANAFCDPYIYPSNADCPVSEGKSEELYLINETGDKKTIIGKQMIKENDGTLEDDFGIGILKLYGEDIDLNGNTDVFTCGSEYGCPLMDPEQGYADYKIENLIDQALTIVNIYTPMKTIKENSYYNLSDTNEDEDNNDFVLISPFRMSVEKVEFIINPVDDPYKAFAEPNMQVHPSVTIIMTVKPSVVESERYPGEPPAPFTIQRTVTTAIHSVVESFPQTNDLNWIKCTMPGASSYQDCGDSL